MRRAVAQHGWLIRQVLRQNGQFARSEAGRAGAQTARARKLRSFMVFRA